MAEWTAGIPPVHSSSPVPSEARMKIPPLNERFSTFASYDVVDWLEALVARRKISRSDAGQYGRAQPEGRRRSDQDLFGGGLRA